MRLNDLSSDYLPSRRSLADRIESQSSMNRRDTRLEREILSQKDPALAYSYARDVIGGRWPEAERLIFSDPAATYKYAAIVIGYDLPQARKAIVDSGNNEIMRKYQEWLSKRSSAPGHV